MVCGRHVVLLKDVVLCTKNRIIMEVVTKCAFWCGEKLFLFFQAEDGIRDIGVTGVQTCALPICDHQGNDQQVQKRHPATGAAAVSGGEAARSGDAAAAAAAAAAAEGGWHRLLLSDGQIGRASCRERVEISVVGGSFKKKIPPVAS